MSFFRVFIFTTLALIAFAANSLLCRLALAHTKIDAATFTSVRLVAGALVLFAIVKLRGGIKTGRGNWFSAFALFAYAAGFSFAYISLPAAVGALILFATVQATMISVGIWRGESFIVWQRVGFILALSGLVILLFPGLSSPPLLGSLLMMVAGISWGIYSLRGKNSGDPLKVTAGNFIRASALAFALSVFYLSKMTIDSFGVFYAILSGAIASGIGYAIWYTALPHLRATHAATLQLCVPVIATLGGILFLNETLTVRFIIASLVILGGIGLVISEKAK